MTTYTARIYDTGLNLVYTTTNVVTASGRWRKNDVGTGSLTFPAQDTALRAATLQNNRIVHVTTSRGGSALVVALFNIEERSFSLSEDGQELVTVSGSNFEERIGRHLVTAEIHDGDQGPAPDDIQQIMSHIPGWSLHGTSVAGTEHGTRHTFKNATGLQALAAAAEQSGEMWRLFSLSTIAREIIWTRVPSGSDSWNFTLYFKQPASFNEATDALILSMDRGYDRGETVTRIYVYGAGTGDERITLFGATWTPPAGFSLNDQASLLINSALEATGQYCVREVVFSDIALPELKFGIVFASDADDYFTVKGDQRTLFTAGYVFEVEGHPVIANGTEFTVASSLYDIDTDHTVISVVENVGTDTAGGSIVPTGAALDAAQEAAANALAQRAYYWLRDRTGGEQFHHVRAIYHRNIQPGDKARIIYDNGGVSFTEVHQVVEAGYSIDGATGIRYTDLTLAPLDTLRLPQTEEAIAGTIMATMQNLMRYGPGGRTTTGAILPTMGEHLAHPDPHPTYLRADGGRTLVGNLPVASGVTIDGVDLSALKSAYDAHLPADSHTQYVHVSTARTISARHTFAPASANSPFILSANAQGQTVVGLRADQLDKSIIAGSGLTGGGLLSADRTLNVGSGQGINVAADSVNIALASNSGLEVTPSQLRMGAPATLAQDSASAVTGSTHSHAVTASAAVTSAASTLLKSDASGHLQLIRLGLGVAPAHPLHVRGSSPQLRLEIDGTHTGTIGVDSSDNMELAAPNNLHLYPAGDVVFNPGGKDLLPLANYDLNIGALHKKWLALHAAELKVETLVAHETMATIGGRILVGPGTTTLAADLADSDTEMVVKHNQMDVGDIVYMESAGKVEFFQVGFIPILTANPLGFFTLFGNWTAHFANGREFTIRSSPNAGTWTVIETATFSGGITTVPVSGSVTFESETSAYVAYFDGGPYAYLVTRNLDGTDANEWFAGDAVVNTGKSGDGFIDLYSVRGLKSAAQAGPTIVGNVRNSATYNDWSEHWAIGNLNGLYGYGADTFGAGFGKADANNLVVDAVNGIRFRSGTTVMASLSSTTWQLGQSGEARITITPTAIDIYNGAASPTSQLNLSASGLTLRNTAGNTVLALDTSGNYFALPMTLGANGGIWQGTGSFASPTTGLKLYRSGNIGVLASYNGGTEQMRIGSDGYLYAGNDALRLSRLGLWLKIQDQDTIGIGGSGHVNFGDPATQTLQGAVGGIYTNATNYTLRMFMDATNAFLQFARSASSYTLTLKAANAIHIQSDIIINLSAPVNAGSSLQAQGNITSLNGHVWADTLLRSSGDLQVAGHARIVGLTVGASGSNLGGNFDITYVGNLRAYRGSTAYTGYIYVPLTAGATTVLSNSVQGAAGAAAYSRATLGVPSTAKAVQIRILYQSATNGATFYAFPVDNDYNRGVGARISGANNIADNAGIVEIGASNLVVRWTAAGALWLDVQGYFI